MAEEIINARIASTNLGIEDHGIFTFFLHLEFDGYGQVFGGHTLDTFNEEKKRRVGHAFGADCIMQILEVLKVHNWEDLRGKYLHIKRINHKIIAIGHIIENKWFNIEDLVKEHF